MPGTEAPLHLCRDKPNSQVASGGASKDLVAHEMGKEGALLSRGAQLHAVPVQDGTGPGSNMGLGTRELHIRLMERDRSQRATCRHVHVHGGGARLRVLAGP